jgi:hypothetical protein
MPRDRIISPDNDKSHVRMDLENAPEIATELGHMCVAWAAAEWRIFAFYVAITGCQLHLREQPSTRILTLEAGLSFSKPQQ